MTSDSPRLRIGLIGIVAVSLFAAMFARLWYLQVMAAPQYEVAARANQQREVIEPAPRGRILDRNGVVLVDNRISRVVALDRQLLDELTDADRSRVLGRLAEELTRYGVPTAVENLEEKLADASYSPYAPVPVSEDVPEELAVYLSEHRAEFSAGLTVETRAVRTYPYGRLAAHVLGYVGSINDTEYVAQVESGNPGEYQLDDEIGKTGVERSYEADLRGTPGRRIIEVDAEGKTVRQLRYVPPVAGDDLVLTIDANVQALAEQALEEELIRSRARPVEEPNPANASPAGSTVILDPRDGSVVAMASFPDFDLATFTNGIDTREWDALNNPASYYPLNNRAIQGQYSPGSTFKLITAYGAMKSGAITEHTTISDGGSYRLNPCTSPDGGRDTCVFRNAGGRAYGQVDLRRSLTVSSDVYYYQLGARFWFNRGTFGDPIQQAARAFGMGAETGIPLPGEQSGIVPTPEFMAERHEQNPSAFPNGLWQAGHNVNLAIGQGDMLVTPLQLANAYATLVNGGTLYSPNIAREVRAPNSEQVVRAIDARPLSTVELPPQIRQPILDGLVGAVNQPGGTAFGTFLGFPDGYTLGGKTGTAETPGDERADNALFVGFGPMESPQYVIVAVLEESGFGGVAAAPLVRRLFEPLANPALMPTVKPGGGISSPLPPPADPFAEGDVTD